MIIIQLAGGLGNQMFQYALYLQLKELGKQVKIDDISGFKQDRQRDPYLWRFGISYETPSVPEMEKMLDASMRMTDRIRRKVFGRRKKAYFEEDKLFHPEILTWDDIYLEGYFQSEKYFEKVSPLVKQTFDTDALLQRLNKPLQGTNRCHEETKCCQEETNRHREKEDCHQNRSIEQLVKLLSDTESVSVHVRGGDYLRPENEALFGNICTREYYQKAISLMEERHPGCRFFLFTNDREWAQEFLGVELFGKMECLPEIPGLLSAGTATEIHGESSAKEREKQDMMELALMSKCKHHVLANSSFSWWASYLNKNPNKTVLAPETWLNGWDCRDFYRKDMEGIKIHE